APAGDRARIKDAHRWRAQNRDAHPGGRDGAGVGDPAGEGRNVGGADASGTRRNRAAVGDSAIEGRDGADKNAVSVGAGRDRATVADAPREGRDKKDVETGLTSQDRAAVDDATRERRHGRRLDAGMTGRNPARIADATGESRDAGDGNAKAGGARRECAGVGDAAGKIETASTTMSLRRDDIVPPLLMPPEKLKSVFTKK